MKNTNQKLLSLNEEYSQKIKELNEQLEEYKNKNNNDEENGNENTNKSYGFKKLISVMNIGGGGENEENEKNKKTENIRPSESTSNFCIICIGISKFFFVHQFLFLNYFLH